MTKLKAIGLALLCALFVSTAQIFQKLGGNNLPELTWPLLVGLLLYTLGWVALITALKEGALTVVFPIVATSYILAAIYAVVIFNEQISLLRWVGIALIFAGVAMVGVSRK
ncbi:EamA family transporter [Candidatus Woesearchaeota archaeon]|nr:EamA family transporter [Candidatus Woesearchaeota archaeon]MBW3005652.1 EamA family transporter [Candidatus Woesearchaeota archaeon]